MLFHRVDTIQAIAERIGYKSQPAFQPCVQEATGSPPANLAQSRRSRLMGALKAESGVMRTTTPCVVHNPPLISVT
jgi:AraC-like DNA-binding protein